VTGSNASHHLKSTLIHGSPRHADVEQRSDHCLSQLSDRNTRPEFGNAGLQKRIVQEVLGERNPDIKVDVADDNASRSSSDLVEVEKDVSGGEAEAEEKAPEGPRKRKGKGKN